MKYLSIAVAAMLVLLAAPLRAQSAPPNPVSAMGHRGGGQGSDHGNNGWQGRGNGGGHGDHGNGGWQGDRGNGWNGDHGRNDDHGRGWNRDDEHGHGRDSDGHWVWVADWYPVLRCHGAFWHLRWAWEWERGSHREWRPWN